MSLTRQIPKEEIKSMPLFAALTPDDVTLVDSEDSLAAALPILQGAGILGFDTESRPTFHKGEESDGPHLLQLATDAHAWLFPIRDGQLPEAVRQLLADPACQLVGFDLVSDRARLKSRLGIECQGIIDLGHLIRSDAPRITVGAVQAVARLFGQQFHKSKKLSTTNWSRLPLSPAQQAYAGNDAWVALRIYRELAARGALPANKAAT
ncbi:3'-5' exonuclease [uncultured Aquitalea sp.]|uniref:3'-5' exonuclease n=1 Tax=uncultured Aquitalea sp. TaxID=540272 RepID=UPI0025DB3336|nr:3'-5' exonuclease [uncultured Aquitalea sp.]